MNFDYFKYNTQTYRFHPEEDKWWILKGNEWIKCDSVRVARPNSRMLKEFKFCDKPTEGN